MRSRWCASLAALWLLAGPARAEEPPAAGDATQAEVTEPPPAPPQDASPGPPASGEPRTPRTQREYTDLAVRRYAQGRYDEAIKAFSAAYVLRANPVYLFNIAQCHRKAGRPQEAAESYELFLREAPSSPLRPEAEGHLRALRARLAGPAPPPAPPHLLSPPPAPPVYRRAWFWAVLGVAAAGAATGLAVGISFAPRDPMTTLGITDVRFRSGN